MPGRSALCSAVDKGAEWEISDHLLAALVDEMAISNYFFQSANFKGSPKPPKPIPRPENQEGRVNAPSEGSRREHSRQPKGDFASTEKVASVFASLQF